MSDQRGSISWFTVIGALAAAVHYAVAVGLNTCLHLPEAWVNIVGFLCAFPVSYLGHRNLTFKIKAGASNNSLPKFFLVACMGFISNQCLVLMFLRFTTIPFWLILAIVMVVVAIGTYVSSRFWAFRHDREHPTN